MKLSKFITLTFVFLIIVTAVGLAVESNPNKIMASFNPSFSQIGINYYSHPIHINGLVWEDIRLALCNSSNVAPALAGNCTQVYYYNSTSSDWKMWDINTDDSINTLVNASSGRGYLVNVTDTGNMNEITGGLILDPISQISNWAEIQPGWNLRGWTTGSERIQISLATELIYGNWSKNITRVWGHNNNLDITQPLWPEDPNSEFIEWLNAYWVCVSEVGDNDYCKYNEPPLMPWQNQRPSLDSGVVTNTTGFSDGTWTFSITYTDLDNEAAGTAQVVIDGTPQTMTLVSGTPSTGATYEYTTSLTANTYGYYFNFNDGNTHVFYDGTDTTKYPKPNNLTLIVTNPAVAPTADFTMTPSSGFEPLFVTFTDISTDDGTIMDWEWDFDNDGTPEVTGLSITNNTFTAGTHNINLTVTDNDLMESSIIKVLVVGSNNPPTADFMFSNLTRTMFGFIDVSSDDNGVTAWQWNFGDGSANSTIQHISHNFTTAGDYTVTLTVFDAQGEKDTWSDTVHVGSASMASYFYGYDKCNNDIGWSIFTDISPYLSNPNTCGNGKVDCCGWYIKTHVHDLGVVTPEPVDLWFKTRTGFTPNCNDNTLVYTSVDNSTWNLAGTFNVIAKDMDGQYGFPEAWKYHTFNIRNYTTPFRYVKISSPKCFDDYSEVTAFTATDNMAPVPIVVGPTSAQVGETVTLNASQSYDPDGTVVEYEWIFGDYSSAKTNESIVIHVYDGYFVWGGTTYNVPLPTTITIQLLVRDDFEAVTETTIPLQLLP